jgi:hypothetical protein
MVIVSQKDYACIVHKGDERMKREAQFKLALFLLVGIIALAACQPATPTPIPPTPTPTLVEAVYYRDNSADGKIAYAYFKFYGNGRATQVGISLEPPATGTAVEVYNTIAISWLEFPPPNPAYGGTYTLRGSELSLVLINNLDTKYMSGTYAPGNITVAGSDGISLEYLLLPLP